MTTGSGTAVTVIARLKAAPGKEAAVREQALALVGPTLGEAGCLSYRPYEDPVEPGSWIVVEEWTDRDAFEAHLKSPHLAAALAAGPDLLSGPPEETVLVRASR
ncbi:putative quinol monooxygenase [Streptomyces gardneri]|uniref:Antibiotic biosynthesis monooxygenase n=1 Tax=Streptomyces gardneri TaxID=66892 RepID=A0A4Y3RL06_9ACTN|nr:putative quinol monooxygenase [Streptomyces gardneri]GEB58416.1 antibiotic biosynthesis monooxygenase [Streptomyces gardneri]GHH03190.1 antibiotic biosynthesis monooxygenase [Streptomyces gardneri]